MTNGTFPKRAAREPLVSITIILLNRGLSRGFLWRSHAEKLAAMLQLVLAVSIAKERAHIPADEEVDLIVYSARRSFYEALTELGRHRDQAAG